MQPSRLNESTARGVSEKGNRREVLAARKRELAERPPVTEAARRIRAEGRLLQLEREGAVKRGTGMPPDDILEPSMLADSKVWLGILRWSSGGQPSPSASQP